jgi:dihydrolipoamide dehydrogenase
VTEKQYDVAVIGGGPGGYVAAIRAAQLGLSTVLIERTEIGGVCLNWGCVPTKALLRSAEVLRLTREAAQYGVMTGEVDADLARMVQRSRDVAGGLSKGVQYLLRKNGVHVVAGAASLKGRGMLEVVSPAGNGNSQRRRQVRGETTSTHSGALLGSPSIVELSASHIIVATGARARALPSLPFDGRTVWSYREALSPPCTPKHMLIVGAGAIGVEFASFYRAVGVEITLLERADRILPTEDVDVSTAIADALSSDGVAIRTSCEFADANRNNERWTVNVKGGEPSVLEVDVILVAIGIVANTEGLGLENTKMRLASGHILIDGYCRTAEPGVYAIGDVAGAPWLAHKASHEGTLAAEHIAGVEVQPLQFARIPSCVYSHLQAARVGLTEAEAVSQGREIKVGRFPFSANGKALAMGCPEGFVKVVFDAGSGELLGAHLVGHDVTEMIQSFAVTMGLEATEVELMRTVVAHPTMSEAMYEAVLAAYGRALHY